MRKIFYLILISASLAACTAIQPPVGRRVVIDTDSGNGIDDYYAISRLLLDTTINVVAINSAQYNNPTQMVNHIYGPDPSALYNTALESFKRNKDIVSACKRDDVPLYMGANLLIGDPWEQTDLPSPSDASAAIIKEAHNLPDGEKLYIISIGAATNIASAIIESPDIVPNLSIWMMGGRYYPETGYLDKSEYNSKNDLNAFDLILKTKGLEVHLMDGIVSDGLEFNLERCSKEFSEHPNSLGTLLSDRWTELDFHPKELIVWDLAVVEAFLTPSTAKERLIKVLTKAGSRKISIFTGIDATQIENIYWNYYNLLK